VNTPALEDEPTISGDWLLFHRLEQGSSPGEQVILRNVHTGETRTIASVRGRVAQLEAGQVNGDWAVFTKTVNGTRFNVWLYQISTKTLTLVPNPRDKVHSAAAVNPFGTVYFEESGSRCGSNATVEVYPIGGPMITAGTLRPGIDMFHPVVFEHASTDSFMFAKLHCVGGATDVFESNFACAGAGDGRCQAPVYSRLAGVVERRLEAAAAGELEREVLVVGDEPLGDHLAAGPAVAGNEARHRARGLVRRRHRERHGAARTEAAAAARVVEVDVARVHRQHLARLEHPGELLRRRSAEPAQEHVLERLSLGVVAAPVDVQHEPPRRARLVV